MPSSNGPPRYFLEAAEMVIGGLPGFSSHYQEAKGARRKKLEPIVQVLLILKSGLTDFFSEIGKSEETENITG
ncbi:MAG: hypothetical protein HY451_01995 [Parcubacteria group bacterium]|nr:hypothetical protein [Parcubacteria group bacterium]